MLLVSISSKVSRLIASATAGAAISQLRGGIAVPLLQPTADPQSEKNAHAGLCQARPVPGEDGMAPRPAVNVLVWARHCGVAEAAVS